VLVAHRLYVDEVGNPGMSLKIGPNDQAKWTALVVPVASKSGAFLQIGPPVG
jgi:hypothetical protein